MSKTTWRKVADLLCSDLVEYHGFQDGERVAIVRAEVDCLKGGWVARADLYDAAGVRLGGFSGNTHGRRQGWGDRRRADALKKRTAFAAEARAAWGERTA